MLNERIYYYFHDFNNIYLQKNRKFILEFEKEKDRWGVEVNEIPCGKNFLFPDIAQSEKNFLWPELSFKITSKLCISPNQNILTWMQPAPNAFRDKFKNLKLSAINPFDNSLILEIFVEAAHVSNVKNTIHCLNDIFNNKISLEARMIKII